MLQWLLTMPRALNFKGTQMAEKKMKFIEMTGATLESMLDEKELKELSGAGVGDHSICLLYTSPSPRDRTRSRMPSSA